MRIVLAALLGTGFVLAGEVIRRRSGDGSAVATAYLPSVFSAAGIVTLYGAALSACLLYDKISAETALILLVIVASISVALAWFQGPLLSVIGLLGAVAAPFLVGGEGGSAALLHGYFGLVALAGLLADVPQRNRGVAELAVVAPLAGGVLVSAGMEDGIRSLMVLAGGLAILYPILRGGKFRPPLHGASLVLGERVVGALFLPLFWIATCTVVLFGSAERPIWSFAVLAVLFAVASFWSRTARAGLDLAVVTGIAYVIAIARGPDMAPLVPPDVLTWRLLAGFGLGVFLALSAARRSNAGSRDGRAWAILGAALAVAVPGILEIVAVPAEVIGPQAWSAMILAFAAACVFATERAIRGDGGGRTRAALAAVAGFALVGLALFVILSGAALSAALGVLILAATFADDSVRLPALGSFVRAGAAVLLYRTVVDPGILPALGAPILDLLLGFAVPLAGISAAWLLMRGMDRPVTIATLEGTWSVLVGTATTVVVLRFVGAAQDVGNALASHHALGLIASIWFVPAIVSLRTALAVDGTQRAWPFVLRIAASAVGFVTGLLALGAAATIYNPLVSEMALNPKGPPFLSTVMLAYALPALVLGVGCWALRLRPILVSLLALPTIAAALLYAIVSIAHFWRGPNLRAMPMGDGELWTYSALLIAIGAGLLLAGIARSRARFRGAGNAVLVLAILKVFFVDAADLDGLARAGSFLLLGLSLAGIAWLDRCAGTSSRSAGSNG